MKFCWVDCSRLIALRQKATRATRVARLQFTTSLLPLCLLITYCNNVATYRTLWNSRYLIYENIIFSYYHNFNSVPSRFLISIEVEEVQNERDIQYFPEDYSIDGCEQSMVDGATLRNCRLEKFSTTKSPISFVCMYMLVARILPHKTVTYLETSNFSQIGKSAYKFPLERSSRLAELRT